MPKLLGLLADAGPHGAAFKFVADTPTITMSRLKAILTGGLPTFLDIGQSFSAAALGEDNLLGQLWSTGARVVVMGDDTWAQLAPASSYRGCHTFPSFDVHDLHTVDDGVWREVWPYLRPNASCASSGQSCSSATGRSDSDSRNVSGEPTLDTSAKAAADWELLVAHYLGVDHAGHTYGGNSAQMYGKLQQMDDQISDIADALLSGAASPDGHHSRTLLLVMGDHGQTLSGDHGGGSDAERDSVLLAFHVGAWRAERERRADSGKHSHNGSGSESSNSTSSSDGAAGISTDGDGSSATADTALVCNGRAAVKNAATGDARGRGGSGLEPAAMPQIDLTSSLALLLGLPIPFGNLGKVNRRLWQLGHVLPEVAMAAKAVHVSTGENPPAGAADSMAGDAVKGTSYLEALRVNAVQVDRYLTAYAARGGLPTTELGHCRRLLAAAREAYAAAQASLAGTAAEAPEITASGAQAEREAKQTAGFEALEATAEAAYEGFLDAAGALARRKFTRFDLPLMAAGALLCMAACLGLHAWLLCRLWRASGGRAAPAAAAVLTRLLSLVAVGLVALHAFGLFSAGWIQGEGRLHCYSLAAASLLLWLRAAVSAPVAPASGQAGASEVALRAGVADKRTVKVMEVTAYAAAVATGSQSPTPATSLRGQCTPAGAPAGWWRRQLWVAALALAALGANVTLQRYSLIDRWGSDPHDKRQLATAGTVAAAVPEAGAAADIGAAPSAIAHLASPARSGEVLRAAVTLLPVLLLPVLLQSVAVPWMRRPSLQAMAGGAEGRQQRGRRGVKARSLLPSWPRAVFCHGCFVLVACWWLQQLLLAGSGHTAGTADRGSTAAGETEADLTAATSEAWGSVGVGWLRQATRSASLRMAATAALAGLRSWPQTAVLITEARRLLAPVVRALAVSAPVGMKLWAAVLQLALRWPPAAAAVEVVAGAAGAVWQLPLRLLLPRLVYVLALAALVKVMLVQYQLWLRSSSSRSRTGHGINGSATGQEPGIEVVRQWDAEHAVLVDASFGALASAGAVLTLLLGPRGPAVVLLLAVQGASLLALLLHAAANTRWLHRQPKSNPTAPAGAATAPLPPAAVAVVAAAAGCLLSLLGGQAFFLTGHFCEFSGLQYDSPFVGFDHMTWAATPLLFWINSFGGLMLPAVALPLVAAAAVAKLSLPPAGGGLVAARPEVVREAPVELGSTAAGGRTGQLTLGKPAIPPMTPLAGGSEQPEIPHFPTMAAVRDVGRQALVWLSFSRSLALAVTVLSAAIQRHHVVVWALFAPKLVFEVCFAAATYMAMMLAALGL